MSSKLAGCVCVYYCRTYYKAVRGGGRTQGGEWTTCAMIDDEPRPLWVLNPGFPSVFSIQ